MLQYCTLPGLRPFWILHCDFGLPSRLFTRHPFRARISAQNTPALSCRQPIHHMLQPLAIAARSIRSSSSRGRHCSIPLPTDPGPPPPQPSPSHRLHHPSHRPSSHLARRHVISPSCHLIVSSHRHAISSCHLAVMSPHVATPRVTLPPRCFRAPPHAASPVSPLSSLSAPCWPHVGCGALQLSPRASASFAYAEPPRPMCGARIEPVIVRAARRPSVPATIRHPVAGTNGPPRCPRSFVPPPPAACRPCATTAGRRRSSFGGSGAVGRTRRVFACGVTVRPACARFRPGHSAFLSLQTEHLSLIAIKSSGLLLSPTLIVLLYGARRKPLPKLSVEQLPRLPVHHVTPATAHVCRQQNDVECAQTALHMGWIIQ